MSRRIHIRAVAPLIALFAVTPGSAAPIQPIVNGSFEAAAPGKTEVCAVAGDDTWVDVLPDRSIWLARVHPCEAGAVKAAHWSSARVTQFGDVDGDGDREASIDGSRGSFDGVGASHNLWQAYPSPHQAYSGNFDAFAFAVQDGSIPGTARVVISLSTSPREAPSPFVGVYFNCDLTLRPVADDQGAVRMEPVDGTFRSRHADCDVLAAAWTGGDDAVRRSVLSRLRIVQVSFWSFETGAPLVIDDVAIEGARTVAEEAAGITL